MVWLALATFTFSILFFFVVERLTHALLSFVWFATVGTQRDGTAFNFAAMQLLVSAGSSVFRVATSVANVFTTLLSGLAAWAVTFFVLLLVTAIIYMFYEQYPLIAQGFILRWNESVGPRIHAYFILPLDLGSRLLAPFAPIYNTFTWIAQKAYLKTILQPAILHPEGIIQAIVSLFSVGRTFAESIQDYLLGIFACLQEQKVQEQDVCAVLAVQELDLVTPMLHIRNTVAHLATWITTFACAQIALPLDILTAPFMDVNLAKALHSFVNAITYTLVQLPVTTEARCRLYYNTSGAIMCIPDIQPTFGYVVEGLRRLGQTIDTWLNIMLLVVQQVIDPDNVPSCDPIGATAGLNASSSWIYTSLFGSNHTVLVGLTETMYAQTDGVSVLYYSTARVDSTRPEIAPAVWPIQVRRERESLGACIPCALMICILLAVHIVACFRWM